MKAEVRNFAAPRTEFQRPTALVPLALLAISVPSGIWWFFSQLRGGSSESVTFDATVGCFVILAMAYLSLHGLQKMAWTSIPVLVTFEALVAFVVFPEWQFITGADSLDGSYNLAMFLVLVAFAAFWLGSLVLMKESGLRYAPSFGYTPSRVLFFSVMLLVLGIMGNALLWRLGLFGYTTDPGLRTSFSGVLPWIAFVANLLSYALVVSAIEVLGKPSADRAMTVIFWLSILISVGLGALSGMKSQVVTPIITVILVYGICKRRIPRTAILLPVFFILIVYPFVEAFRGNLNVGYSAQFNTVNGLQQTLVKSFDDAFLSFGSRSATARNENIGAATSRLSYLSYVRDVSSLPVPSMLQGDEKLWMAPFYPLVPRFLWKSKPILNKGVRLSVLLGHPSSSSSAPTPIGDLYSVYGTWGVAIGMLIWGACVQIYMNWVGGRSTDEKGLFIYVIMLSQLLNLEDDFTGLIAGTVQLGILVVITAYLIYGRSPTAAENTNRLPYSPQV